MSAPLVLLLSVTLGAITGAPGGASAGPSGNDKDLTRWIEIMSIPPWQEETRRADVDQAVAGLRAMRDAAIEPLMDELRRSGNPYLEHRIVPLLGSIGTAPARESLLWIALGRDAPGGVGFGSSWAARHYVQILPERSAARRLLVSKNTDVQAVALRALSGVSIDVDLLRHLEGFLQSDRYYVRTCATDMMAADPEATLVPQKVSAIVRSLETVESLPQAGEKFQSDWLGTLADNVYRWLIEALGKMKGADEPLREQTGRARGTVRVCLLIARGGRGDPSVKGELRIFLQDTQMQTMTMMRCAALRVFETTGTPDDLAFLQETARTDPLEVWIFGGPLFEMISGKLVNTGERMAPVPAPTDPRWSAPNNRIYPVRRAAEQAMRVIKGRPSR
jgi:hypothetical protein